MSTLIWGRQPALKVRFNILSEFHMARLLDHRVAPTVKATKPTGMFRQTKGGRGQVMSVKREA